MYDATILQCVYLSIYVSILYCIYLSIYLSIYLYLFCILSIYLSIYLLFNHLSHYLSTYVSILQCIYPLSINANNFALYLFIYIFCIVSIYLSIYSAMYLPICYRWEFCFCVGEWVSGSRFPPPPPTLRVYLSILPWTHLAIYLSQGIQPSVHNRSLSWCLIIPASTTTYLSIYLSAYLSRIQKRYDTCLLFSAALLSPAKQEIL